MISDRTPLTDIKGVGEKTAALFSHKGIFTAGDLIRFYPRDYEFYEPPVQVDALVPGRVQAVTLTIIGNGTTVRAGSYKITGFRAGDASGNIRITYFNMPYLVRSIRSGSVHVFRGMVRQHKNGNLVLEQPSSWTPADYEKLCGRYLPKYSLSQGMKNRQVQKLVQKVLGEYSFPADYLPEEDRKELGLMEYRRACTGIHFPASREEMVCARNRLVFDEFLAFLVSIRKRKDALSRLRMKRPMQRTELTEHLLAALPYELTDSQKGAWREIEKDLTGEFVMNRLLQGDVGSGKTILAFLALLLTAANGRQGALMAPTEVLAAQHMKDMEELAGRTGLPLRPVLLTGSLTAAAKRKAYERIREGDVNVIIGTHALIQEKVEYHDLGLVITDEQHRFGVLQRETLAGKGDEVPVLVMSATPIPRTLSIILYGDLQVSRLLEMPRGRLPIKNLAAPASDRGKIYRFILGEIEKGHQAYVICPAVEEGELEGIENVTDYTQRIRDILPGTIRIASLTGRMKPAEKNRIMEEFAARGTDILVSTTVIEVGINVPNATVMLVENAERFGLSQLHQLRGRVGRGNAQSYCVFLYSEGIGHKPERLKILEQSNDGFHIAEEDLRLRGPGDLFGVRQSGELGFVLADIYEDAGVLQKAAAYADRKCGEDPSYEVPGAKSVDFRSI